MTRSNIINDDRGGNLVVRIYATPHSKRAIACFQVRNRLAAIYEFTRIKQERWDKNGLRTSHATVAVVLVRLKKGLDLGQPEIIEPADEVHRGWIIRNQNGRWAASKFDGDKTTENIDAPTYKDLIAGINQEESAVVRGIVSQIYAADLSIDDIDSIIEAAQAQLP